MGAPGVMRVALGLLLRPPLAGWVVPWREVHGAPMEVRAELGESLRSTGQTVVSRQPYSWWSPPWRSRPYPGGAARQCRGRSAERSSTAPARASTAAAPVISGAPRPRRPDPGRRAGGRERPRGGQRHGRRHCHPRHVAVDRRPDRGPGIVLALSRRTMCTTSRSTFFTGIATCGDGGGRPRAMGCPAISWGESAEIWASGACEPPTTSREFAGGLSGSLELRSCGATELWSCGVTASRSAVCGPPSSSRRRTPRPRHTVRRVRRPAAQIPGREPARGHCDRTGDGHHRGRQDMMKRQRSSSSTSCPGRLPVPTNSVVLRRKSFNWLA